MFEYLKKMFGLYDTREKILISMLKDVDFLNIFSDSQLYEFSKKFKLKDYKPWDIIVEAWTKPDFVWLLESWEIQAQVEVWGKILKLWDIKRWDMYLELAYFNRTTTVAKLICKNPCIAWEVPIMEFDRLIKENKQLEDQLKEIVKFRNSKNALALQNFLKESNWWQDLNIKMNIG